ncbi:MAG TPA: GDSL-type esterase/lipase family protein [bacterium]|nr:GDSL-type esterase/lipase family protein [bacterium]
MIKKIFILILLSLTFLIADSQNKRHSPYYYQKVTLFESLPNDSNEIVFLGNSITDGCEWSELFDDLRIKNRGISGDVTLGVLDRLYEVTESHPLQIFIMIGVNDLAAGISQDTIFSRYERIIKRVKSSSPKTELFVQSVLPVNPEFKKFSNHVNKTNQIIELNKKLKKLCKNYKLSYIDLHSFFKIEGNKLNPEYTNDGLHLTGKGYLLWKSLVEGYISR